MAVRSSWKGFLKLGMVAIPVKAYSVSRESRGIQLHQLHRECHSRIRHSKVCPVHGEVHDDDIVSGYEYAKDQYVIVDLDELRQMRSQNERAIEIDQFIPAHVLDTIYHAGRVFYLVPDGPDSQIPYAALRDAMAAERSHAIAQTVIANRDELVRLSTSGKLITMTVLNRAAEIMPPEAFQDELTDEAVPREELDLTRQLIQSLSGGLFELGQYRDTYRERLMELIQSRIDGKEVVRPPVTAEPQVISLREALKGSLEAARKNGTTR